MEFISIGNQLIKYSVCTYTHKQGDSDSEICFSTKYKLPVDIESNINFGIYLKDLWVSTCDALIIIT